MNKENDGHLCPVCGKFKFPYEGSFETCEVCGWTDDLIQFLNPDEDRCANRESLNEYRAKWRAGWRPKWFIEEEQTIDLEGKR